MILQWLNELAGLGLFQNVDITFDGSVSVKSFDVVMLAFFLIALANVWLALKFFLKKVI